MGAPYDPRYYDPPLAPRRSRRQRLRRWLQDSGRISHKALLFLFVAFAAVFLNTVRVTWWGPTRTVYVPAKQYGDCHIEVYDTDRADDGVWSKVTTPGYDCPPMAVWPIIQVNRHEGKI